MIRTTILTFFSMIFLIFHADLAVKGAASGLLLWYSAVVPALFPFMVLSSALSASCGISWLMRPFTVVFRFFQLSAEGWYVLLTGLLCGCPMGAKTCAELLCEKRITPGEAGFLFALCNHPSPMFLAGFVYPLFAGKLPLSCFVCAIYAPLFLLAIPAHWIYRRRSCTEAKASSPYKPPRGNPGSSHRDSVQDPAALILPDFTEPVRSSDCAPSLDSAILNSAEILMKIGGYLVFYSILILVIRSTPMIPVPIRLVLSAVLEITTGIHTVCDSLAYPYSAIAAAAVFSFGGFSAVSQTNAVIRICETPSASLGDRAAGSFSRNSAHKKIYEPAHPGVSRGHLRQSSSSRECVTLAGSALLFNRKLHRYFLLNKNTAGLSIRQYLLWKIAHASLTAAIMAALTGVLRFPVF